MLSPRKYDALLFGQVINPNLDLFAFWHSDQTDDPGLNVALYANKNTDKLLENMRLTLDENLRQKEFEMLDAEIQKDTPAVFLYSPDFIYVMSPIVKNVHLDEVTNQSDRFGSVFTWYIETDKVWQIFAQK
jgi:peptide/nickel transport system substrate-binding protein